jgi:polyisoprenyl-teichoic acid--peptidoglycan teichoic acid transferase
VPKVLSSRPQSGTQSRSQADAGLRPTNLRIDPLERRRTDVRLRPRPQQFHDFAMRSAQPAVYPQSVPKSILPIAAALPAAPLPAPKVAIQPAATSISPSRPVTARLPLDMNLPGVESPSGLRALIRQTKWRGVRRWAFRGVAVALVLVITLGGLLVSQGYLKANKVFRGTAGTAAALKPNVNPDLLKGEGSGRVNILLLGRGGGDHDGPDLTDSMMVASIDPINHTSTLLSLPRDLWVTVPNEGVMKINAAWETGEFKYLGKVAPGSTNPKAITAGFTMVDQTVSDVLGIDIDYNVLVDFQAFQQAVDTVGGVTVNVPTDLVDPTMAWQNGGNPTLAQAGIQQFNGAQALLYVRSRETSSDFARAARQRAVLVALKSKVVSLGTLSNPLKISSLLTTFGNNVQTDLSLSNASRLYSIIKGVDDTHTNSISLDDPAPATAYVTTGNINGQSIVLPSAGLFNYQAIQQFVRTQLPDPYIAKEDAKVLVLNGTPMPGLATAEANQLKTYGYNVVGAGNTPSSDWAQTRLVDLSNGKDKYTAHYLEERLGVTAVNSLPDKTIQTNGADFVIILGSDDETTLTTPATPAQPPSN